MNMSTHTPSSDDQSTEAAIVKAGKTAPRITPTDIEAAISSEHFFTADQGCRQAALDTAAKLDRPYQETTRAELTLLTFCVLVLRNGFTVTGESACASPENFDAEIGRKVARANAVQKIWPLEGYLLKQHLFESPQERSSLTTS
jgi:hypothetical protein